MANIKNTPSVRLFESIKRISDFEPHLNALIYSQEKSELLILLQEYLKYVWENDIQNSKWSRSRMALIENLLYIRATLPKVGDTYDSYVHRPIFNAIPGQIIKKVDSVYFESIRDSGQFIVQMKARVGL